ncbi:TolC family outer membrane protein [Leucothrix pacifica]|uniref:Type I secretion protein TolC n=1 Tax=Leucothrix pacifica TaxID=1247513 RepID=A0A317CE29_9GAMM|nr:TolC family outer membrane protein [Leucothrix pacifica]PWQ96627.1 type I secretion protein TolC [Leucothrix pacifica]
MTTMPNMGKIAVSALLVPALLMTSAQAEDLFTVYQHAKESDPQIRAAEAGYLSTLEKLPQSLAALKPKVTLSANASYSLDRSWTFGGNDNAAKASANYTLSLSKPLYRPQIREQIAQTNVAIAQAEESLLAEQQNLILRVAEAYFTYLTARDGADFSRSEAAAIERQYKQVEAYFEAGRSAITDVKESQSRYDQAVSSVVVADQNVDIALESLHALTGRYYRILRGAGATTPLVVPTPNDISAWSQAAIQNNKQVKISEYSVENAQKAVDIARAGKKPTLDLFANHGSNIVRGETASNFESTDVSIGVQFNMTLYDAGSADAAIREARYGFHQALQQLESTKRSASQQARTYYLNIITGLSQIQSLKRSLESSQVASKATQEGFRVGTRTAVDVLLALRDTYQAQSNYSSARYTFLLNTIRLKQAAGTLSENDLRTLSRILNRSQSTRLKPVTLAK